MAEAQQRRTRTPVDDGPRPQRPTRTNVAPRLPQSVYKAFKYGSGRHEDLHVQASWAIGRATFAGLELDDILELLQMPGNRNGAGAWWWHRTHHTDPKRRTSVDRMRRDVERKMQNCLAAKRSEILDASQARLVIRELYDRAIDAEWLGRTATSDRKVYIAHCQMALEAGHIADYGASVRQLAIEANVTRATAREASRRLIELGALQRVKGDTGIGSARWRLVRSWGDKLAPSDLGTEEVVAGGDFVPPSHPAFAHGSGLHYPTWLALRDDDLTARQIAESLGKSGKDATRQTRHRLAKLQAAGLAAAGDHGWYRTGSRKTLDAVAMARGTTKRMNERRERYKQETREHRATYLLGQSIARHLKAGSQTELQLVATTAAPAPQVRQALDEMRGRDYAMHLPDGRWALVTSSDPNQVELPTPSSQPLEQVAHDLRAALEAGPRTPRELAAMLHTRTSLVTAALAHLEHLGIAWRVRNRCWALTPDTMPPHPRLNAPPEAHRAAT